MTGLLRRLDRFQQRTPLLAVPIAAVKRFGEHAGGRLTTTIAYWSFFSIFPLLLVFVTTLNIVLRDRPDTRAELVDGALGQVPVIGSSLGDSQAALGGSWLTVVIGVAAALWSGLAAASQLQVALDEIWDVPSTRRPNGAVQRVRSLTFLAVLAVAISASTLATNIDSWASSATLLRIIGVLLSLLVNGSVIAFAFWFLTSERRPFRQLLPGTAVAAVAITVLQQLGTWVVTRYLQGASDTYGTFATVIALLSWLYLISRVVLLGAEVNAVLVHKTWPRTLLSDVEPTDGDVLSVGFDGRRIHRDERIDEVETLEPVDGLRPG